MVNLRQLLISSVLCLAFLSSRGTAQTLTAISDTVTQPNGSVFNGIVKIVWTGGSGGSVAPTTSSARVYGGLISVLLVPTTTVSPCAYYTVNFISNDGLSRWTQLWYVPMATATLTIAQVLTVSSGCTSSGGGGGGSGGSSGGTVTIPIPIADVSGLAAALAAKPNMSSVYNNSTTAWIDSSGNVGSIPGNATDCVHVNGTSGPCATLPIQISNVTNLSSTLATFTPKSATYNNSTTAWIDSSGNVGSIPGNATDCVHVNGTSGPCATLPIQINNVTNLSSTLATFPVKSAGYSAGHTAVVDSGGNLSTAVGNSSDCVHVDGSTGPCGSGGSGSSVSAAFVDAEVPSGTPNGSNLTFNLSQAPSPATSLELFRNGVLMQAGLDFSLSATTLTFSPVATPQANDLLLAYYRVAGSGSSVTFVDGEVPAGSMNGTNTAFALASAPATGSALRVYKNGVLLEAALDYTVSGKTITFINGAQPNSGDTLLAYYRN